MRMYIINFKKLTQNKPAVIEIFSNFFPQALPITKYPNSWVFFIGHVLAGFEGGGRLGRARP